MTFEDQKKPALIIGSVIGFLTLIPYVSACFCLYALAGGAIATKMVIDKSPTALSAGDGARMGLITGLIGGGIYLVIGAPLTALFIGPSLAEIANNPQMPPNFRDMFANIQNSLPLKVLVSFVSTFIGAMLVLGFTVLGGLLGIAIFEKRRGQNVPPPPSYDAPQGYTPPLASTFNPPPPQPPRDDEPGA